MFDVRINRGKVDAYVMRHITISIKCGIRRTDVLKQKEKTGVYVMGCETRPGHRKCDLRNNLRLSITLYM